MSFSPSQFESVRLSLLLLISIAFYFMTHGFTCCVREKLKIPTWQRLIRSFVRACVETWTFAVILVLLDSCALGPIFLNFYPAGDGRTHKNNHNFLQFFKIGYTSTTHDGEGQGW